MRYNTTGSYNISIGINSQSSNYSNSIILGKGACATGNSQFVLGSYATPIGNVSSDVESPTHSMEILLNGSIYRILLFTPA